MNQTRTGSWLVLITRESATDVLRDIAFAALEVYGPRLVRAADDSFKAADNIKRQTHLVDTPIILLLRLRGAVRSKPQ